MSEAALLRDGADFLRGRGLEAPQLVLVLGSGLKNFGAEVEGAVEVQVGYPVDEAALRRSRVKIKKLLADQGF